MADLTLQLGSFTFSGAEIPQTIPFGGEQSLVVHKLVGGTRIVDAMGRDDAPIEWSGIFLGENALQRARQLNDMRIAGAALSLSYRTFNYTVVIKSFTAEFERFYQIHYKITLEVVQDFGDPTPDSTPSIATVLAADAQNLASLVNAARLPAALNQALNAAVGKVTVLASGITSDIMSAVSSAQNAVQSGISSATGALQSATDAVQSGISSATEAIQSAADSVQSVVQSGIATATSALQSAKDAVSTAQGMMQDAISSANDAMGSLTTLGGIVPGSPISAAVDRFTEAAGTLGSVSQLTNIGFTLDRLAKNLDSYSLPPLKNLLTVVNPNLYKLAAEHYGDAALWTVIAQANSLTDPLPGGAQSLTIPPKPTNDTSGGVLV